MWVSVIERGVASGEFRDNVDARLVVAAMFDAVLSTTRWFTERRSQRPDDVGNALADLFLGGMTARSTAPGEVMPNEAATDGRRSFHTNPSYRMCNAPKNKTANA